MARERSPVLVTGAHRSGTTWVGRTLCFSRDLGYIQEPFNPVRRPSWTGDTFQRHGEYICEENGSQYEPLLMNVLRFRFPLRGQLQEILRPRGLTRFAREEGRSVRSRLRGSRPLLKDPDALFSAPWLARNFGMEVIVTIRHPGAVVASMKRQNWSFEFGWWAEQELFLRDQAGPFADQIVEFARRGPSFLEGAILYWNVVYDAVSRYRERYPSWIFVRHEDLAQEPLEGFHELYQRLYLPWTDREPDKIVRYTSSGNPQEKRPGNARFSRRDSLATASVWRERLEPDETRGVHEGTFEVASRFYSEEELSPT